MIPAQKQVTSQLLAPAAMTNTATRTANLDCIGADWATIILSFASELNTNAVGPTISLLTSDDTEATNFATVTANRTNEDLTAAKLVRYDVDTKARKRYLRISVTTATATNDNVTVDATAIMTRLQQEPAAATNICAVETIVS